MSAFTNPTLRERRQLLLPSKKNGSESQIEETESEPSGVF